MAKTEDIEARLAAFVDGELDEAGRAELEKHLSAHPEHRQLLMDLMGQRDVLRGLPREEAPPEVSEAIHAQLERAVLLGDIDAGVGNDMRIGFFSQWRAVAAVLLITGSLAAVIVALLPSADRTTELADFRDVPIGGPVALDRVDRSAQPVSVQPALETAAPSALAVDGERAELAAESGSPLANAVPAAAPSLERDASRMEIALSTPAEFRASSPPISLDRASDRATFLNVSASNGIAGERQIFGDIIREQAPPAQASEVIVLATDDPGEAMVRVKNYLRDNNFQWVQSADPTPAPVQGGQSEILASRMQSQSAAMKTGAARDAENAQAAPAQQELSGGVFSTPGRETAINTSGFGEGASGRAGGGRGGFAGAIEMQQAGQRGPEQNRLLVKQASRQQAEQLRAVLEDIRLRRRSASNAPQVELNTAPDPSSIALPNNQTQAPDGTPEENQTARRFVFDDPSRQPDRQSQTNLASLAPGSPENQSSEPLINFKLTPSFDQLGRRLSDRVGGEVSFDVTSTSIEWSFDLKPSIPTSVDSAPRDLVIVVTDAAAEPADLNVPPGPALLPATMPTDSQ